MAKVTGEGSIIQMEKDKPKSKCRKWQLRVPIGMNPRTGKYQQKTRVVDGTFLEDVPLRFRDAVATLTWRLNDLCVLYMTLSARSF